MVILWTLLLLKLASGIRMKFGFIYPHTQGVAPGSTATFTCHSTTPPIWSRQGNPLNDRSEVDRSTLRIHDVKSSDEGEYLCVGLDGGRSQFQQTAKLYVGILSPKRIQPDYIEVSVGQPIEIKCLSQIKKNVHWMFNNGPIHKVADIQKNRSDILWIPSARAKHSGLYTCHGRKWHFGRLVRFLSTAEVRVFDNSKIKPQAKNVITGQDVTITCGGSEQIGWDFPHDDNVIVQDNTLTIRDIKASNRGNYICKGTTDSWNQWTGEKKSFYAISTLAVLDRVHGLPHDINIWPERQIVPLRGGASIYCSSFGKFPAWYFNGRQLAATHTRVVITNVESSHQGTYVCKGWTIDQRSFSATSTLIVRDVRGAGVYPPEIDMTLGGMIVFTCLFNGPVQWKFNDNELPPSSELITDNILLVKDLTAGHAGIYTCADREKSFTKVGVLRMFDQMQIRPYKVVVYAGQSAEFKCISDSTLVQWHHKEQQLAEQFKELSIHDVSEYDEGYYDCTGEKKGHVFRTRGLLLVMRKRNDRIYPHELSIRRGETARFECKSDSEVTWKFEKGKLPLNARVEHDPLAGKYFLVIESITKANMGYYQCEGEDSSQEQRGFYDEGLLIMARGRGVTKPTSPMTKEKLSLWQRIKRFFSRHKTKQ